MLLSLAHILPFLNATVSVSVFRAGDITLPVSLFAEPVLPGHERLQGVAHSFLIEHRSPHSPTPRRLLFDLGVRKDVENFPPSVTELITAGILQISVKKDVAQQLTEGGIPLKSIESVVWSHSHYDHVGAVARFPKSVGIVFGPGTTAAFLPGYPKNNESTILESDLAGRKLTELSFNHTKLKIGGFRALDYFNDGSLYFLDVPGHLTGHITALARVTPTTFVYLGGDTYHHPGELRPSPNLVKAFPCPADLVHSHPVSPKYFGGPGPGHVSADMATRNQPLLLLQKQQPRLYQDPVIANQSIHTTAAVFDADPNVFVIVGHDASLLVDNSTTKHPHGKGVLRLFPRTMNNWKAETWKERGLWAFLDKSNPFNVFQPVANHTGKRDEA